MKSKKMVQSKRSRRVRGFMMGTLGISLLMAFPSMADEWKQDAVGYYYRYSDGSYAKSGFTKIGNEWYYFSDNGYMLTGWQKSNNQWYYMHSSGKMVTGWQKVDDSRYYFGESGAMQVNQWVKNDGNWNYVGEDGKVVSGWKQIDGKKYYFSEYGTMMTGWLEIGTKKYYLNSDGVLQIGTFEMDGNWYNTNENGALIQKGYSKGSTTLRYAEDGSILRYNVNEEGWEYMPGLEESTQMMMEKFEKDYLAGMYPSEESFELDVTKNLSGYLSEEDLRNFMDEVEIRYLREGQDYIYEGYENYTDDYWNHEYWN